MCRKLEKKSLLLSKKLHLKVNLFQMYIETISYICCSLDYCDIFLVWVWHCLTVILFNLTVLSVCKILDNVPKILKFYHPLNISFFPFEKGVRWFILSTNLANLMTFAKFSEHPATVICLAHFEHWTTIKRKFCKLKFQAFYRVHRK